MASLATINISSNQPIEFIDITALIQKQFSQFEGENGILLVYTPHTTAGITINENADPDVTKDIKTFIERKIPHEDYFRHMEGNSPGHIMSSLFSASEMLIVEEGKIILGTWQGIYFCEFDGPRRRRVLLKFINDSN